MDKTTRQMIANAYDETVSEALATGHPPEIAHKEGMTAAAMFLASMAGIEDGFALSQVETLGLSLN